VVETMAPRSPIAPYGPRPDRSRHGWIWRIGPDRPTLGFACRSLPGQAWARRAPPAPRGLRGAPHDGAASARGRLARTLAATTRRTTGAVRTREFGLPIATVSRWPTGRRRSSSRSRRCRTPARSTRRGGHGTGVGSGSLRSG